MVPFVPALLSAIACADVAQLVEQPPRKWQVVGSNPTVGSKMATVMLDYRTGRLAVATIEP
jgi:hypothetical protein